MRCGRAATGSDMLAGNANRIVAGEPMAELTPAKGSDTFTQPLVVPHIHQ